MINPCRFLERLGATVTYLRVDGFGRVNPDDVRRALRPSTIDVLPTFGRLPAPLSRVAT